MSEETFTTIDGRTLKVHDYFEEKDFITDNGKFVKHDALLRVCKALFYIKDRDVRILSSPSATNGFFASATVTYGLVPKKENIEEAANKDTFVERDYYSFTSSADCTPENRAPKPADIYYTAMAETRASGRALRFLLGVDFCTKEEIGIREEGSQGITDAQMSLIEKKFMSKEGGFSLEDVRKILNKTEEDFKDLKDLTLEEASNLINKLHNKRRKEWSS